METLNILATHEPFELFLERHTSYDIVGTALDKDDCPLVRFLKGKGYPKTVISSTSAYTQGLDQELGIGTVVGRFSLPMWAKNFISIVDRRRMGGGVYGPSPIIASEALAALKDAVFFGERKVVPTFSLANGPDYNYACSCHICTMAAASVSAQPYQFGPPLELTKKQQQQLMAGPPYQFGGYDTSVSLGMADIGNFLSSFTPQEKEEAKELVPA